MDVKKIFGCLVFNDESMKAYLSDEVYAEYRECADEDKIFTPELADKMADAMMKWAIDNGCTHYTHWFQPMTGITAEKHDSFIKPVGKCEIITEFRGKELIKGEPDASSFPSGGLRATFEARGYTAWDPTSYAFIKDGVLCIPTAFCSYTGEALDKKTPLLRSMQAINKEALRVLRIFGRDEVKKVIPCAGPEQEYFLVDRQMYKSRPDLVFTGRTLFGARSPKGQELDDHYFGAVKPRVVAYMKDLDIELWKVGVFAKTKHNEVAPAQHELASVYCDTNLATDHNQLVMELMKKVAARHGFKCLLHEKPFEGINGSGKHNNWSLSTDTGANLLDAGDNPSDNMLFLIMLCSVISAVDKHQDLLRISVASADNDHRLGKQEAPPAIVSIFLGEELLGILEAIADGRNYSRRANCEIQIGAKVLPRLRQDSTDRNRTSPFAFTGNKFEFRMPGSRFSVAGINTVINTIVADELSLAADKLEKAEDLTEGVAAVVRETMEKHKRIIFNGNGYSEDWVKEAEKRGLLNLPTTVDAMPYFTRPENIALFSKHEVFKRSELEARSEILAENYCKKLHIEALTMSDMTKSMILPAVTSYLGELAQTALNLTSVGINNANPIIPRLNALYGETVKNNDGLEKEISALDGLPDNIEKARAYRDKVIPAMERLRTGADAMELLTAKKYWPFPTYADLLFSEN
jgi:glutamine synthetase